MGGIFDVVFLAKAFCNFPSILHKKILVSLKKRHLELRGFEKAPFYWMYARKKLVPQNLFCFFSKTKQK